MGDTYAVKLNLSRKLPDNDNTEEYLLNKYSEFTNSKIEMFKANFPSEESEE